MFDFSKLKDELNIHIKIETLNVIENEYIYPIDDQPYLALTTIINNSKFIIMNLSLFVNDQQIGTLAALRPSSNQPFEGATIGTTSLVVDDPSILDASFSASNSSQLGITALAAGSTNLTITADITYNKSNGESVTVTKSVLVNITVSEVIVEEEPQLVVQFTPVSNTTTTTTTPTPEA